MAMTSPDRLDVELALLGRAAESSSSSGCTVVGERAGSWRMFVFFLVVSGMDGRIGPPTLAVHK